MILRLVILATTMVGCIPNNDDLPLGSADVSIRAMRPGGYEHSEHWPIASAWASDYYDTRVIVDGRDVYPGSGPNGYGGFEIVFSPETTSPAPPTCRDRAQLASDPPKNLDLHGVADGKPSLPVGDVSWERTGGEWTASFQTLSIHAGHVTITAVDDERITGTFDGSSFDFDDSGIRYESAHVVGYFDVPICWN